MDGGTQLNLDQETRYRCRNVAGAAGFITVCRAIFLTIATTPGIWTDESGEDLPNLEAAEKAALVALADAARDMALAGRQGSLSIQVRDESGILLQGTMMLKTATNHPVVAMEADEPVP